MDQMKEIKEVQVENKKLYEVDVVLENMVEEEENRSFSYTFKQPNAMQFTRYIKEVSKDTLQASKNIVLSNVLIQDKERLEKDISEYPGIVITIAQRFLQMLGFTDNVTFRRR